MLLPLVAAPREPQRIDLSTAEWTLDGRLPEPTPSAAGEAGLRTQHLPIDRMGRRWAVVLEAAAVGSARLHLDFAGDPAGLLFEVQLDGQRLLPLIDGWRPAAKPLAADLGTVWLGPGPHLLEFVAREQPAGAGVLRPAALHLRWL
ncbi:MAG: hypothetical protein ACT4PU_07770 [Planctomycetota bacterium]